MKRPNIREQYVAGDGKLTMDGYKLLDGYATGIQALALPGGSFILDDGTAAGGGGFLMDDGGA